MELSCKSATRCGACQLIGVPYEEQLERKQREIESLFADLKCPADPIIGMDDPLHYRTKVISPFAPGPKGRILTGMYAAGSHRLVSTSDCLVENEDATRIIRTIRDLMRSFHMRPYDENTEQGYLRHAQIRTGKRTGEVMVTLVTNAREFPSRKHYVAALRKEHPNITTIVQNVNTRQTNVILGERENVLYGPGFIIDELCGCRFRISSRAFFQVNPVQAERLYDTAIEHAEISSEQSVIDAYCGTGTIGLIAAGRAKSVMGVEENADAVACARTNAKMNHRQNARFTIADAGAFMREMAASGKTVDTVLMDPPRSGSDERFLASLETLAPACISYISCNPTTQRRDVDHLLDHGYRLASLQPVDMFPFTNHVECVALLSRKARKG